jgi:hypothetical protein
VVTLLQHLSSFFNSDLYMAVTIFLELDNESYVGLFQVNCAVNLLNGPSE